MASNYYRRRRSKKCRPAILSLLPRTIKNPDFEHDPWWKIRVMINEASLKSKTEQTQLRLADRLVKELDRIKADIAKSAILLAELNQIEINKNAVFRAIAELPPPKTNLFVRIFLISEISPEKRLLSARMDELVKKEHLCRDDISNIKARWRNANLIEEIEFINDANTLMKRMLLETELARSARETMRREAENRKVLRAHIKTEADASEKSRKTRYRESMDAELERLRAMAASVVEKSRERADRLKSSLRSQVHQYSSCPYCFGGLEGSAELDHIIPIVRGGLSTRENLVYVCSDCNQKKRGKTLAIFIKSGKYDRQKIEEILDQLGKSY